MNLDFNLNAHRVFDILSKMDMAVFLCQSNGHVVTMTEVARAELEKHAHLFVRDGVLLAANSEDNAAFRAELSRAMTPEANFAAARVLVRHPDQPPRFVKIAAFPDPQSEDVVDHALVILAVQNDADPRPYLRKAFGWSPAEVEIAIGLADGRTVAQIAGDRSTSVSTVRTQIKTMIEKAGATSQVDLIARVVRLLSAQPS